MSGSTALSPDDEGKLTWYLSRGQTLFEKSNFGAQLERLTMYGNALDQSKVLDPINDPYPESATTRVRRKRGWAKVEDKEIVYTGTHVTAHPTAEVTVSKVYMPDDSLINKAADADRRLTRVGRINPLSRAVLELYYGDRGARYAGGRPGRLFSIYVCTQAGQDLLARDRKDLASRQKMGGTTTTLADHLRMENQAAQEFGRTVLAPLPDHVEANHEPRSKRWRRLMLSSCDLQARQLLANAGRLWNRNG